MDTPTIFQSKGGQSAAFPVYHQAEPLIFPTTFSQEHAVPRLPARPPFSLPNGNNNPVPSLSGETKHTLIYPYGFPISLITYFKRMTAKERKDRKECNLLERI